MSEGTPTISSAFFTAKFLSGSFLLKLILTILTIIHKIPGYETVTPLSLIPHRGNPARPIIPTQIVRPSPPHYPHRSIP